MTKQSQGPKRLKNLRLDEVSLVDDPANVGAEVVLVKHAAGADEEGVEKFIYPGEGTDLTAPLSFAEAMQHRNAAKLADQAREEAWKAWDALKLSIMSIIKTADEDERADLIGEALDDFKGEITRLAPTLAVQKSADGGETEETTMELEELEKALGLAETAIEDVTKRAETAEQALEVAEAAVAVAKAGCMDCETAKACKAAGKCGKTGKPLAEMAKGMYPPVKKSAGGDDDGISDEVLKSLPPGIRQAVEKGRAAEVEARVLKAQTKAEAEFPALPGEAVEKGRALLAIEEMPEAERATVLKMLKAGDAAMAGSMEAVGKSRANATGENTTSDSPLVAHAIKKHAKGK